MTLLNFFCITEYETHLGLFIYLSNKMHEHLCYFYSKEFELCYRKYDGIKFKPTF